MLSKWMVVICLVKWSHQNVVSIVQGRLRGEVKDGFVSYVGIPYASVSSTTGRYRRAGLAPLWEGIRLSQDPRCTSTSPVEDCLQLDVHVPATGGPRPVLVWVKGGSGQYQPNKLLKEGIIVVVVRHRLGTSGFLCSNDEKIPGNAGLKDVVIALRWIRDNIVAFRGNPHKVVVGGQSFGAAMAEALTLSPMAQGLFHGIILQSGTALSPWAFNYDAEERAKSLQMMFTDQYDVTIDFFNIKAVDLDDKANKLDVSYLPFAICAEKAFKNEERFLSASPMDVLNEGNVSTVPIIIGYNTNEAYIFASMLKEANLLKRITRHLLPIELQFLNERDMRKVMKQIKDIYFKNNITMAAILSYHRDAYFLAHIHRSACLHAAKHPVYYYQFSYSGDIGVQADSGISKYGAAHSDELGYIFPVKGRDYSGDDGNVQQHLIKLWTTFVNHLNPTADRSDISWDQFNCQQPRLLDIQTELQMKEFPHATAVQMWEDIYDRYYYSRRRQGP